MNNKYVIMPNITLGETIINYFVDYYKVTSYLAYAGIPSATGWHERPVYKNKLKFCYSDVMSAEALERFLSEIKDKNVDIEFIK